MPTFADIFCQNEAVEMLSRALCGDRLPHGLIFAGPVGVGKGTTARALAAVFLCENPAADQQPALPCGQCESCRLMASGNHPDYHVIYKELIRYHDKTGKSKGISLSLDVLRPELIEPANRKPALNRGKVFVIEQADSMTPQAQNATLKTLEEPAGRTLIVLLTDQPGSLLATIRSRCQLIRFGVIDEQTLRTQLQKRNIDPAMAQAAAHLAEGSLGLALKWIEDGVVTDAGELIGHLDQMALTPRHQTFDLQAWFKSASEAYAARQLARDELASKDQATREGLTLYLKIAASVFRHRLRGETDPQTLESLCAAIDAIARAETYLNANVNISLIFQQLSLSLQECCP